MGFGEAAQRFAADFRKRGLKQMVAYSRAGATAKPGDEIVKRAAACGVRLVASPQELAAQADVILGMTPGATALAALKSLRPHLTPAHVYADASTSAVKTMERAAELVKGRAQFVDAAIMGPVPLNGIRVLTVASGKAAPRFVALMRPWGMNTVAVSDRPGAASAMKLIRSVCFKGLACLLIESLEAAERSGILDFVAKDMAGTFDERPFLENMKRFVCGTTVHAARRVHEMTDVMALLNSLGSSTRMTRTTTAALNDVAAMGLREHFNAREPDSLAVAIRAIVKSRDGAKPRRKKRS